jgi:hypothetical protein
MYRKAKSVVFALLRRLRRRAGLVIPAAGALLPKLKRKRPAKMFFQGGGHV